MTYFHPIFLFIALLIIAIQTTTVVLWRTFLSWNYSLNEGSLIEGKFKAVIFDFDGTTANTMPFLSELAVELIAENYNISRDEAKRRYLETTGMDFASQLKLIFSEHPKNKEVAETFEARKLKGIFDEPIFTDAIPTLKSFKEKGLKTFICSSTKQEIITKYCYLNKINGLVEGAFGYKPDFKKDKQIDFILKHYRFQPDEVIFVGDSLKDYDFINDKRIRFIGITRIFEKIEFHRRGVLSVGSLTELIKLFDRSEKFFKSIEILSRRF